VKFYENLTEINMDMNINGFAANYQMMPLKGQRVLILTHLRGRDSHNTRVCKRLWDFNDPAFRKGTPFDRRLSLIENNNCLPEDVSLRPERDRNGNPVDDIVFSATGRIDDPTPPPEFKNSTHLFYSAAQRGFSDPENHKFVLGGGNFSVRMFKTFRSLVEIKDQQGERLQVVIPFPLVYFSANVRPMVFSDYLHENWKIDGYRIIIDGKVEVDTEKEQPFVELHWFKSLMAMFDSNFFPEIKSEQDLSRVMDHFRHV
jgi:hypothetical protein